MLTPEHTQNHGGKMTAEIADADFVILGHPTTQHYEEWLRRSLYFGKTPVHPNWIQEYVVSQELLSLDDFMIEGTKVEKKKKGRKITTNSEVSKPQKYDISLYSTVC